MNVLRHSNFCPDRLLAKDRTRSEMSGLTRSRLGNNWSRHVFCNCDAFSELRRGLNEADNEQDEVKLHLLLTPISSDSHMKRAGVLELLSGSESADWACRHQREIT